jgi:hypothetical protein
VRIDELINKMTSSDNLIYPIKHNAEIMTILLSNMEKAIKDLETSMLRSSTANERLATKLCCLNGIIAISTFFFCFSMEN